MNQLSQRKTIKIPLKKTKGPINHTVSKIPAQKNNSKINLQEFREIFRLVDTDDSGDISREELFGIMKQIGLNPTMAQVNNMLSEVDEDENGTIDFDEFVKVMTGHSNSQTYSLEQILQAFKIFDRDGKGYLTIEKMEHILTHYSEDPLSSEDAKKLLSTLDHEKKGIIHYHKYCTIHSV